MAAISRVSQAIVWGCIGVFFILTIQGCRSQEPLGPPTSGLSGPAVLVPVGILKSPRGIAVDSTGDIWVSDTFGDRVVRFSQSGSVKLSFPGFILPGYMGVDRPTDDILLIDNGFTLVRIRYRTETASNILVLNAGSINPGGVFDVQSLTTIDRTIFPRQLGDLDGSVTGEIYVNLVSSVDENVLVKIAPGSVSAAAFSSTRPLNQNDATSQFVSVDQFGTVYSAFLLQVPQVGIAMRPYVFHPGNIGTSHAFSGASVSGGTTGSGIDQTGTLYIADPAIGEFIMVSTASERTLERFIIPPIAGMVQPAPWDVGVSRNGNVYVAVIDLFDTSNQKGAVLVYTRVR